MRRRPTKQGAFDLRHFAGKDKTMKNTFIFNVKTSEKGFFDLFDLFSDLAGTFSVMDTVLNCGGERFMVTAVDATNNAFEIRTIGQDAPSISFITDFILGKGECYELTYKHIFLKGDLIFTADPLKAGDYKICLPKTGTFIPPILKDLAEKDVTRRKLKDTLELLFMRKDRLTNLIKSAKEQYGVTFQEYAYMAVGGAA